jgi:mitogen-activated protein kinase organizer 1
MDRSNGQLLNTFEGHLNHSYRSRACFGHGEATVICGDEDGKIWAWDLIDVGRPPIALVHI